MSADENKNPVDHEGVAFFPLLAHDERESHSSIITAYLLERVAGFRELVDLRRRVIDAVKIWNLQASTAYSIVGVGKSRGGSIFQKPAACC